MSSIFYIPLWICAQIYSAGAWARNWFYNQGLCKIYSCHLPVVSIGNVSAGGNAKTPIVIFLAHELILRGYKPVILLRGYGGRLKGPHLVSAEDVPSQVGDEACLIRDQAAVAVVIARDRAAGARFIENAGLGNLILLDDGFQHRRLARSVDIVTVNVSSEEAIRAFLKAEILPLGRFREPRDAALKRADIIVLADRQVASVRANADERLLKVLPRGVQVYQSYLESKGIVSLQDAQDLTNRRVVAFCGIANADGFFLSLRACGCEVVAEHRFADHFPFTKKDIEKLRTEHGDLPLVCTSKDAVKIRPFEISGVYELRVVTKVLPTDAFVSKILKMILSEGK